jgi:hypothetical protein
MEILTSKDSCLKEMLDSIPFKDWRRDKHFLHNTAYDAFMRRSDLWKGFGFAIEKAGRKKYLSYSTLYVIPAGDSDLDNLFLLLVAFGAEVRFYKFSDKELKDTTLPKDLKESVLMAKW